MCYIVIRLDWLNFHGHDWTYSEAEGSMFIFLVFYFYPQVWNTAVCQHTWKHVCLQCLVFMSQFGFRPSQLKPLCSRDSVSRLVKHIYYRAVIWLMSGLYLWPTAKSVKQQAHQCVDHRQPAAALTTVLTEINSNQIYSIYLYPYIIRGKYI